MSSISNPEFDSPVEDLVGYLDGELPADVSRRVEERLAADPEYREQLRDLDQTWEALDALPAASTDDHFMRTTIEMVAVAAEREVMERAVHDASAARQRYWRWALAGVAAVAIGFAAARLLWTDANSKLINDLPVINQYDVLSQIGSADFLQKLSDAVPLERLTQDPGAIERGIAELRASGSPSPEVRRRWVAALSPEKKAALSEQAIRFDRVAGYPQQRKQIEDLEREIQDAGNAEQLQKTLIAYGHWLEQRTPGEQEDIREAPTNERLSLIQKLIDQDQQRALRHLSDAEIESLSRQILAIYEERKADFVNGMRERGWGDQRWLDAPPPWIVALWAIKNEGGEKETTSRLIQQLSADRRAYWEQLRGRSQREQLARWIGEAMRPRRGPEELARFFAEKLDNKQREKLLDLPRDEMQVRLEWLYTADLFGVRGNEDWLREFVPPERFPAGPPPGSGGPELRRNKPPRGGDRHGGPPFGGPPPANSDTNHSIPMERKERGSPPFGD